MSIAKHDNVTELSTQNLGALVELQRNEFVRRATSPMQPALTA